MKKHIKFWQNAYCAILFCIAIAMCAIIAGDYQYNKDKSDRKDWVKRQPGRITAIVRVRNGEVLQENVRQEYPDFIMASYNIVSSGKSFGEPGWVIYQATLDKRQP